MAVNAECGHYAKPLSKRGEEDRIGAVGAGYEMVATKAMHSYSLVWEGHLKWQGWDGAGMQLHSSIILAQDTGVQTGQRHLTSPLLCHEAKRGK
jgi:hypothetical protein